jgi:hypothetical protein
MLHFALFGIFAALSVVGTMTMTMTTTSSTSPAFRVLFENHRVRVSDLRLTMGESIQKILEFPTIRWQVDQGIQLKQQEQVNTEDTCDTTAATTQQEQEYEIVPDKGVIFDEPRTICNIQNGGKDSTFRQIWFEIKQTPRRSEEETQRILSNAIYSTDVGTELLFENKYCRVWDFYLEPNGGDPTIPHHHVLDYVFVYVAKGRLLGYTHDGRPGLFDSINDDGDVTWFDIEDGAEQDPNHAHGGKNGYPDIPMREYLVELK